MRTAITLYALTICATAAFAAGNELQPGVVLTEKNWQMAEGLLPPEIISHYTKGEYRNEVAEWKDGDVRWSAEFLQATESNAGRFEIGPKGAIIEKKTGRQPPFIYGFPFPHIDPTDARAGVKILWNYFYGYWSNGNRRNVTPVTWLGRGGVDRTATQDVYFHQYDGQPKAFRPEKNPDNLLQQYLATALEPADLQGTTSLSWRYRAPNKRDSNWAYVPALRRVRQVSPSNRSDGFLGSDMSQDDGPFFDGKPEDFVWKLVDQRDTLRLADPFSLKGDYRYIPLKSGGWRVPFKPLPMAGFQQPGWAGVPWAPVNFVLVKRPMWIIEGIPRDKYYLFGRIQLYIDRVNYRGAWSRKFDWRGQLANTYQIGGYLNGSPDGTHYVWGHGLYYQVAEDYKHGGRATFAGAPPPGWSDPANDFFVSYGSALFDQQALVRFGK